MYNIDNFDLIQSKVAYKSQIQVQLETFNPDKNSSFRFIRNPKLNNLFYWHFHPEYELVYIKGASGKRHVGNHIGPFTEDDLVLIGSNIPHLNFDYGITESYEIVVLHIQQSFIETLGAGVPELEQVKTLFEKSQRAILFQNDIKSKIGNRLLKFDSLDPFQQFVEVLQIMQDLASSESYQFLHDRPFINQYSKVEQKRLKRIYNFVEQEYHRKIELQEIADFSSLNKAAFCRYFKKATGNTFISFLNQFRISHAKRMFLTGMNVSETCFQCGFESLSYFNRTFKKITGLNPSEFRQHIT